MTIINLGIIGLGRMGRIYCRHLLSNLGSARLVAISTRQPPSAAAAEIIRQASGVQIYTDYHEMVADPAIHGVIVATHTHAHRDAVMAAAQAGKAIFCEKPLALTLADTDLMLGAIERAGVLFQVGFMRRFDRGYAAARKRIESGAIGRPIVAQAISRDPGCPEPAWADPARSGGLILDLAIHDFDMLRWLMADEVVHVYAQGDVLTCPDLSAVGDIDTAIIQLRFAHGGLASVEAGRNCRYGYDIRSEIRGTQGTLQIGVLQDTPLLLLTPDGVTHDAVAWFEERFTPAYNAQIDHFVECVRRDQAPLVGAKDARRALEISLAAAQSQREGRPICVVGTNDGH
jgi:inositol 2-dehydrogenase